MRQNSNKNTNALFIGIGLILLIIAYYSFKYDSGKEQSRKKDYQMEENEKYTSLGKNLRITNGRLAEKLNSASLSIIDIRDPDSFEKEHLPGSINIPANAVLEAVISLNKEKEYVLIDFDSEWQLVSSIAGKMSEAGFRNVSYLEGGFTAWKSDYQSTTSEGDPNSFTDQAKVNYIQTDDLKKLIDSGGNLVIIDVRDSQEFQTGHIKSALNIPWNTIEKKRGEIPSGKKIVLYDNTGLLAFKSAVKLFDVGIFNTLTLSDGLDIWKEKQFEIVK